jgi:hypothetical protein
MKNRALVDVVLVLVLALTACATGPPKQWVHPERSKAEMSLDKSACELETQSGARNILGAIEEDKKADLFRRCMQERGYRLEAVTSQP